MPASLQHIDPDTPMGATLSGDGATFRVWAPHARAVYVLGDFNSAAKRCEPDDGYARVRRGFIRGAARSTAILF